MRANDETSQENSHVPARGLRPGVHVVMATPFLPDEEIDEASARTLVVPTATTRPPRSRQRSTAAHVSAVTSSHSAWST